MPKIDHNHTTTAVQQRRNTALFQQYQQNGALERTRRRAWSKDVSSLDIYSRRETSTVAGAGKHEQRERQDHRHINAADTSLRVEVVEGLSEERESENKIEKKKEKEETSTPTSLCASESLTLKQKEYVLPTCSCIGKKSMTFLIHTV